MFWIFIIIIIVLLLYFWCINPLTYWKDHGVKQESWLTVLFDNYFMSFQRCTLADFLNNIFRKFPKSRYYGIYQFNRRSLIIKDVNLLKQMLITDFEHFNEHREFVNEELDPLWAKNLFSLKGSKWRRMRSTLSPSFTSRKMKGMFLLMSDIAQKFINFFLNKNEDLIEIEMKDISSRFCNDVIASTAFGLEVDSFNDPENEFFIKGKKIFNLKDVGNIIRFIIILFVPKIAKIFNIHLIDPRTQEFFSRIIEQTIKMREETELIRPDMIQLLLEARKGYTEVEYATDSQHLDVEGTPSITNEDITAQALVFFFAGFDSVSNLISFMAYNLCVYQDYQDKLRQEIEETHTECNNQLTYDALIKMKFMDEVVTESLRQWPVQPILERLCTKPYTIKPTLPDEIPVQLNIGSSIIIPVYGIHHNPQYFPEPEIFYPGRRMDTHNLLSFGLGPRNCIGARFALLKTKVLFFYLLKYFRIVPVQKTDIPIKLVKNVFSLLPEGGFNMGLERIK